MRKLANRLAALLVAFVFTWAILAIPVRTDTIWIDSVSGSMKSRTMWVGFVTTPSRVERSAVGEWIVKREGSLHPDWRFLTRRYRSLVGATLGRGCALAPEVYPLHAGENNTRYVRAATATELAEFVRTMRNGTAAEKEQAVDTAFRKQIGIPGWN
jgi:hypothetical protein